MTETAYVVRVGGYDFVTFYSDEQGWRVARWLETGRGWQREGLPDEVTRDDVLTRAKQRRRQYLDDHGRQTS